MKLYIAPNFRGADKGDGGIRRVVEAQKNYLSEMGFEIVEKPQDADLLALHAGSHVNIDKPIVNHCHGLYWKEYEWAEWAHDLNKHVIKALRMADAVTAPSEWVANALRRGMWLNPTVLYHGVDTDEWEPGINDGYVLWNKTRADPICDPKPVMELAARLADVPFVTTIGAKAPNIRVVDVLPYEESKALIRNADVYLCTVRETFGIGTLEAMACGVPVLGWAWGGQREIVEHGVTGWLCNPGDFDGLVKGYKYIQEHRKEMSAACINDIAKRWTWQQAMEQYATLYRQVYADFYADRPKVSVVIPCYNLASMLPDAVNSVLNQPFKDVEVIIVNDKSPDNTQEVAEQLASGDDRIRVISNERNLYLAGALNAGIDAARGRYIVPLDADNQLGDGTLGILSDALSDDRELDIVYGAFELIEPDGRRWISTWPPQTFDFNAQMKHKNQVPSTSMYRKKVWDRIGGYRRRCRTAEDADFWCRASSYGFQPAKVTDAVSLIYANRPDSMSHVEKDWPWEAWYPWSRNTDFTPFGAVDDTLQHVQVPSYEPVLVSVVIPVGPGHEELVIDAVESVASQEFERWEVIVINDSGNKIPWLHPFVKYAETPSPKSGPAIARNIGAKLAQGRVIVPLDADDFLNPEALRKMYDIWQKHGGYVYTDWVVAETQEVHQTLDWDADSFSRQLTHAVTAMYPTEMWNKVGGFPEDMHGWEDWGFVLKLITAGCCGTRIPEPLFYYRMNGGQRREQMFASKEANKEEILERWGEYINGGKSLMGCGCGSGGGAIVTSGSAANAAARGEAMANTVVAVDDMIMLEYQGASGTRTYVGQATRQSYRFGSDPDHKRKYVYRSDADFLLSLNVFKPVEV